MHPYHALAPKLNALQDRSDRVSVEVVGQSTLGRDLYLVTVTAPESAREARDQQRWRELIEDDPAAAAATAGCGASTRRRSGSTTTSTATSGRAPTARCA
ncbi:hypothetical protein ACFQV2_20070 [Actinokineospora soli]|uniref:Uncharacterized protein n=1 Tax=Actinokineospora soli TaxID=1048753 RepID=A0ABW2TRB1_9PSEU